MWRVSEGNTRCSTSAVSVADQWWTLASSWHPDRPDRRAPSQHARLYNSHLSLSLFDSHVVLSCPSLPSLLQNVDVVLFTGKQQQQQQQQGGCKSRLSYENLVLSVLVIFMLSDHSEGLYAAGWGHYPTAQARWINVRHALSSCWNEDVGLSCNPSSCHSDTMG